MDAYEEAIETPYLKRAGLELGYIGIMQSIDFLPWCVKFLFAIPTDSYDFMGYGHRRPYVVMGLTLATGAFLVLGFMDPATGAGVLYMTCMIFRNIGIAVSDCAVNGLSVDAQVDSESGTLSGWMSLGRTIGTVACCCVAGIVSREYGYKYGIVASALFVVIPLPANWFIVEEWDDKVAFKDKIEDAAVAATGATLNSSSNSHQKSNPASLDSPMAPQKALLADALGSPSKGVPVWEAPLPFPEASKPAGWTSTEDAAYSMEDDVGAAKVEAARKLVRRPSFIQRVASSAGFDWDLLMELLSQTHVWMFLLYICFTTLGVAVANFSLAAWLESNHGFEADRIGFAMSAMSVGCFVASLPLGYLFDYLPFKRTMLFIAAASCAAANLLLAFCNTESEAYWGLVAFGAAHGAIFVVQCSMARILADSRVAGVLFGIVDSCCNSMHMVGTAITGYIAEHFTGSCEDHQNWLGVGHLPRRWKDHPPYWGACELHKGALDGLFPCNPEKIGIAGFNESLIPSKEMEHEAEMEMSRYMIDNKEPLWCDYILTFYVATAIDVFAIFYVFGIPADKLIVQEGDELKVLPHRSNPIFSEASTRPTALNTTSEHLKQNGEMQAALANRTHLSPSREKTQEGSFLWEDDDDDITSSSPTAKTQQRKGSSRKGDTEEGVGAAAALTDRLGGVVMSEGLATYLEASSLSSSVVTTFLPPNVPAPRELPHSMVHTAVLVDQGIYPRVLPPEAPLSSHIMQAMSNPPIPPNRLAPRRNSSHATSINAPSSSPRSPSSSSNSSSARKMSVAAAMEAGGIAAVEAALLSSSSSSSNSASRSRGVTSTTGNSFMMTRPSGLLPRLDSSSAAMAVSPAAVTAAATSPKSSFDAAWAAVDGGRNPEATIIVHENPLAASGGGIKSSRSNNSQPNEIGDWK